MKIIVFGECIYAQTPNGVFCYGNHIDFALQAAKLGADVSLISAVDPSPLGDQAIAFLKENGIDTALIARIPFSTDENGASVAPWESIPLPKRLPDADVCYFTVPALRGFVSLDTLNKLLSLGQYPTVAADFTAFGVPLDTLTADAVLSHSTVLRFSSDNPSYIERGMDDFAAFMQEKYPSLRYFYTESPAGKAVFYDAADTAPFDCELPVGTLPPAYFSSCHFANTVCAVSAGHEAEEAIKESQTLVRHIAEKGASLPYPKALCRNIITPPDSKDINKKRTAKGRILVSIYAILISVAFIVSTSFAAYFFIALNYTVSPQYQGSDENGEQDQDSSHSFPPLSERPLYTGDDITVPAPEDAQSAVQLTAQEVIDRTLPSVVCVQSDLGEGTGFIITETGYIVTNHHIIDQGTQFTVILHDDTVFDARFVGSDELTDVAVLKIEPGDTVLCPVALGNADTLRAGDSVIAIGSPGGSEYAGTATGGMVSATSRRLTTTVLSGEGSRTLWVIQTDTAVNFGNSGGPLLNMQGQVIGINTLKYAELYFEGLSFSLPINGVMDIVNILMKNGLVTVYPDNCFAKINIPLGITVAALTKAELQENGLSHGILVQEVVENSNAEKDGVLAGDILLSIDGKEAKSTLQVRNAVFDHYADEKIPLTVYRNGKIFDIEVILRAETE